MENNEIIISLINTILNDKKNLQKLALEIYNNTTTNEKLKDIALSIMLLEEGDEFFISDTDLLNKLYDLKN